MSRPRLSASDWNLSIENVSLVDDGMYECQVNTDPKINYKVHLKVTGCKNLKTLNRTNRYVPDPSKSAQADSPHYDVVERAPASGFEQTHSVIKKHHKSVENKGDICLS